MGLKLIFVLYSKGGFLLPAIRLAFFISRQRRFLSDRQQKTIGPDVGTPTEAPEQPSPAPNLADTTAPAPLGPEELTVEEQLILEHEGQAALFEMSEAVPDPADAVTHAEVEEPAAPEAPKAEKGAGTAA